MKCIACGEENVQNARFCAFCGAKLSSETEQTPAPEETPAPRQTARPLPDNPFQPHRAPVIPAAVSAEQSEAAKAAQAAETERLRRAAEAEHTCSGPRQIIKPAPQRVFLFDEEREEEDMKRQQAELASRPRPVLDDIDFEDDEEETDEDLYDEEDSPSGGRIFVRIFSALTVIALVIGIVSFLFGTSIGCRLRAGMGLSSDPADYILLAEWQIAQHNTADASESYYNAFKLDQDNFDLALTVVSGFESAGDDARAEQMYSYLINTWPQADEPYDRLMALLIRQGRTKQYEALLLLRAENQPGYLPPSLPVPDAPVPSHEGGAYEGSFQLSLDAGGADIYYTLDGTAPTTESFLYTGPITLTGGTHNLRAIAVKNGQASPEWTGSYIIS